MQENLCYSILISLGLKKTVILSTYNGSLSWRWYLWAKIVAPVNIGLYRDDGLSVLRNISGQEAEKHKKVIQKNFKDKSLQVIIKCYLKIVDYLDVTFNFNYDTYLPFYKPNEETTCIHVESDHPPQIIKKIPRSIEKRLSRLFSRKKIFDNSKDYYEQRLRQYGYNEKLYYIEENNRINLKISEVQYTLVQPTLQ